MLTEMLRRNVGVDVSDGICVSNGSIVHYSCDHESDHESRRVSVINQHFQQQR
jgi:hypothetical protein